MKKILMFIYIICLTASVVHSQDLYHLNKVVLTAHDYDSKAPIFVKILNDSAQIVSSDWDFPVLPVFNTVTIADDKIALAELLFDGNKYRIDLEYNLLRLTEILPEKEKIAGSPEDAKVAPTFNGTQLPDYTIQESGKQLTITFDHIVYGSTKYPTQTLQGKCEMIYVKP